MIVTKVVWQTTRLYMGLRPYSDKQATRLVLAPYRYSQIYQRVATALTDWECPRTQSEYDNSLTIKLYVLQFVNFYSSLFYIAFFKGRYVRFFLVIFISR